jgi:hypothetical protein
MAIAALILSIVGLVLCWIPMVGWLGVVLALVGVILGLVAFKKGKKGLGITALIIGVVGLGVGLYVQISTILAVSAAAAQFGDLNAQLNDPALQQQLNDAMNQAMQPPPAPPPAAPPAQ